MLEKSEVSFLQYLVCLNKSMVSFLFYIENWPPFEKSPIFDWSYHISLHSAITSFAIWHFHQKIDLKFEKLI
jgi:hypothetical protein